MIQCNDYELLYLMNEFDEEAERILVERYMSVIKYRIKTFKITFTTPEIERHTNGLFVSPILRRSAEPKL